MQNLTWNSTAHNKGTMYRADGFTGDNNHCVEIYEELVGNVNTQRIRIVCDVADDYCEDGLAEYKGMQEWSDALYADLSLAKQAIIARLQILGRDGLYSLVNDAGENILA